MKARTEVNLPPSWRELRPREAAAKIGCSQAYVYKLMKGGQIKNVEGLRTRLARAGVNLAPAFGARDDYGNTHLPSPSL